MYLKTILTLLLIMSASGSLRAAPEPLVIDSSQRKTSESYIRAAHDVIPHNLSLEQVRFYILQASLTDKTAKWLIEEDADAYIVLRWDYYPDDLVLYTKIEFNNQYIQLKYIDKKSSFTCLNNVNGICYKNKEGDYYSHLKRLRNLIVSFIKSSGANR